MEKVYKLIKRKVIISPNIRKIVDLNAEVYSQDIDVTKIVVELESENGELIDLTGATVTVGLKVNNVTIEDAGQVESIEEKSISYCPGERFKIDEGIVTLGFFVTLNTGQRIDIQNYKINFKRSLIDMATEEEVKPYFTSLDSIVSELKKHSTEKNNEIDDSVNQAKSEISDKVNIVEAAKTTAVGQIDSYAMNAKTTINEVLPSIQSQVSELDKQIKALPSVQEQITELDNQIKALPSVQEQITELDNQIKALPQIPDLFMAYADDTNGTGFSETKKAIDYNTYLNSFYKYIGYGVKSSTEPVDYRWAVNPEWVRAQVEFEKSAMIKDKLVNLCINGDFKQGQTGWTLFDISDNPTDSRKYTRLDGDKLIWSGIGPGYYQVINTPTGHKIYFKATVNMPTTTTKVNAMVILNENYNQSYYNTIYMIRLTKISDERIISKEEWYTPDSGRVSKETESFTRENVISSTSSTVITSPQDTLWIYVDQRTVLSSERDDSWGMYPSDIVVYDLTDIFGAGNEPNLEEFERLLDINTSNQTIYSQAILQSKLVTHPINSLYFTESEESPQTALGGSWVKLGIEEKFNKVFNVWQRTN